MPIRMHQKLSLASLSSILKVPLLLRERMEYVLQIFTPSIGHTIYQLYYQGANLTVTILTYTGEGTPQV